MQTLKRMAALLLAVVLVLSCLPATSVFATELPEEETPPATTEAATVPPTDGTAPAVTEAPDPPEPAVTTEPPAPTVPEEVTPPATTEAATIPPTDGTDPAVTEETQPPEPAVTAETTAPAVPEETTAPAASPETIVPPETAAAEETTVPTDLPETEIPPETTAPVETEPSEATPSTDPDAEPTGETTVPTADPTVPEETTEAAEDSTEPTEPEAAELYRAVTEDGAVTAVLFGTAEETEVSGFQVTAQEATEELADSLALALYDYASMNYAPLAVLPFQVGFPSGGIRGDFTLTLTLPGEKLTGDLFVFRTLDGKPRILTEAAVTKDTASNTVKETDATVFYPVTSAGKQGKVIIKGVEDDTYRITEVETANGFTLLKEPIHITITSADDTARPCDIYSQDSLGVLQNDPHYAFGDVPLSNIPQKVMKHNHLTASATVDGNKISMREDNGSANALSPLTVVNTRGFDLPQTGDTGTWMFGTIGIIIMAAAIFVVVAVLRMKKEDEEQANSKQQ